MCSYIWWSKQTAYILTMTKQIAATTKVTWKIWGIGKDDDQWHNRKEASTLSVLSGIGGKWDEHMKHVLPSFTSRAIKEESGNDNQSSLTGRSTERRCHTKAESIEAATELEDTCDDHGKGTLTSYRLFWCCRALEAMARRGAYTVVEYCNACRE